MKMERSGDNCGWRCGLPRLSLVQLLLPGEFLQRPIHNHSGTVLFLAGSPKLPSTRFVIEDSGASMKRSPAAVEKKAATFIWIGTAVFLIGILCLHAF
jgi:hypothetical protein